MCLQVAFCLRDPFCSVIGPGGGLPLHTRSPAVRRNPAKPTAGGGGLSCLPSAERRLPGGQCPRVRDFYSPSYRKAGRAARSSLGAQPQEGQRSRQVPSDLRLCPRRLLSSPCPSSPGCPLTHRGMPAARCPLLQLEQSSSARQRFPLAAALPASCQRGQPQRFSCQVEMQIQTVRLKTKRGLCPCHKGRALESVLGRPMAWA